MSTQQTATPLGDRFHPIANLFPLMEGEQFDALICDIRANGLREPIVEFEGLILDGRNRVLACNKADVAPRFVTFQGSDPVSFVLSANLHRRHLNESQRAMIAARLATMDRGRPENASIEAFSQPAAAKMLNVSRAAVQRAAIVRDRAAPELAARVEQGAIPVSLAAKLAANLSDEQQRELAYKPNPFLRSAIKRTVRARREQALARSTIEASNKLGKRLYNVIIADPPWRFAPYSPETGMDRAADNHYPTLSVDDICKIVLPADDNCVLFLWTTLPILADALRVIDAWGFTYKSNIAWGKDRLGTGYWTRCRHELLLIATKGSVPAPAQGEQFDSLVMASVRRHSQKPEIFAQMIERMFPNCRRLEMFARESREGWDAWGNEVEVVDEA